MSDYRFSCPSCGQHVQCDASHAGENIPCPSCGKIIRVPEKGDIVPAKPPATDNPFAQEEEKASYCAVEAPVKQKIPTLEEDLERNSEQSGANVPVTEREQQIAAARAARSTEPITHVKPRLSFILSGGQAPAPEENDAALTEEQKKLATPDKHKSEIKSLNE